MNKEINNYSQTKATGLTIIEAAASNRPVRRKSWENFRWFLDLDVFLHDRESFLANDWEVAPEGWETWEDGQKNEYLNERQKQSEDARYLFLPGETILKGSFTLTGNEVGQMALLGRIGKKETFCSHSNQSSCYEECSEGNNDRLINSFLDHQYGVARIKSGRQFFDQFEIARLLQEFLDFTIKHQ